VLQILMEADVEGLIGAGRHERSADRLNYRNGYRDRSLDTRLGPLSLRIPKLRQGSYFPPFLEPRKTAEKALVTVIREAWIGILDLCLICVAKSNTIMSHGAIDPGGTRTMPLVTARAPKRRERYGARYRIAFAACKLVLHPEKTKIVYCKDANRRGDFPNQSFDFLGFTFRARKALGRGRRAFACFLPAASPKALTSISRTVRRWALHRSHKSLQDLAEMYNPCIRGWINYYYKTQLRPTLKRIDLYVIRWVRRKFKRLRRKTKGARDWFDRLRRANPMLFAHWRLRHGNGRTSGAV